jgi:hypothetical protein
MDNAATSPSGEGVDSGRLAVQGSVVEGSAEPPNAWSEPASPGRILDRGSLAAGALYLAISVFFLGRQLIFDFGGSYVGRYTDPSLFIWSIAWWPYALSHGLNPILTHVIFAPGGMNLAWVTTVPLASLIMWPITAVFGPIASYNLVALLAPPSAAWAAFILCRYLTNSVWPAILAGYVFGFSSYLLAQTLAGHLHMALVFPVPIAVYLAAQWFNEEIESRTMAWLAGLAIAAQLLLALEVFATATMFAAFALLLGFGSTTGDTRRRIVKLIGVLACAYGVALLIASPFIYYVFESGHLGDPIKIVEQFSADLLNFVVPTKVNALGVLSPLPNVTRAFPGNPFERGAYVGPVLIALAVVYARRFWREPLGKTLIDSLLIICVLSLGPILQIGGHRTIGLPGYLLALTPVINRAVFARFMMYAILILAIITAQWFATSAAGMRTKWVVATLVVLFALPNPDARYWISKSDTPQFFTSGIYQKYISPDETVLVTPYSLYGNSMLWQAQTGFYFRMAGGWTGPLPDEYMLWPVIESLTRRNYLPDAQMQLMSFLANHQVGAIVAAGTDPAHRFVPQWLPAGAAKPLEVGGVTLYRIAPDALIPYRSITAAEAERKADRELFNGVLAAVSKYQAEGRDPRLLTPLVLQNLGLLPREWSVGGTDHDELDSRRETYRGVRIGYLDQSLLGIGIAGTYEGLKPIIDRYREYAAQIYFPLPHKFSEDARNHGGGTLIIFFNPEGLKRAVEANSKLAVGDGMRISQ